MNTELFSNDIYASAVKLEAETQKIRRDIQEYDYLVARNRRLFNLFKIIIIILGVIGLALTTVGCRSTRLTEIERVEKLDRFCMHWQAYKLECYNDSTEVVEYWLYDDLSFDSTSYFEHRRPTMDGFYVFLIEIEEQEAGNE